MVEFVRMTKEEILIHNEQVKLSAIFLNNIAAACIAGGALGLIWQIITQGIPMGRGLLLLYFGSAGMGTLCHLYARWYLKGLIHVD
jgi:hypothetical protein